MENLEPEFVKLLNGLELKTLPEMRTLEDGREVYSPEGILSFFKFFSQEFGEDFAIDLAKKYGKKIHQIVITWESGASKEEVLEHIDKQIYNRLKDLSWETYAYDEDMPEEFKKKHPDLFLPEDAPQELKQAYYGRTLTFDMIRANPQYASFLKGKPLSGRFQYIDLKKNAPRVATISLFGPAKTRPQEVLKERASDENRWLHDDELLSLALEYGDYLYCVTAPYVGEDGDSSVPRDHHDYWSFEQKEKYIQDTIQKSILERQIYYDESAPEFFREKHQDMFLSQDAPDDLKTWFYFKKDPSQKRTISSIAENPEWREFLKDKNISFVLGDVRFNRFFEIFDSDTALKLIYRYPEIISTMCSQSRTNGARMTSNQGTDRIKTWYEATRRQIYTSSYCND